MDRIVTPPCEPLTASIPESECPRRGQAMVRAVARTCADCGYEYREADLERTPVTAMRCPSCGGSRVNVAVYPEGIGVRVAAGSPSIRIGHQLWYNWIRIAVERAKVARDARAQTMQASTADDTHSRQRVLMQ